MMFFKLLKHDIKSTGRWYLLLFVASIIGSIFMSLTLTDLQYNEANDFNLWYILLYAAVGIIIVAMLVYSTIAINIYFYKNMFGREGYLTLTLPVSLHSLILSKVASAIVLTLATLIILFLDIFIILYSQMTDLELLLNTIYEKLTIMDFMPAILLFFVAIINGILCYYMCIAIGQLFTNHRVLMIFVSIFIVSMAQSILDAILNISVSYSITPETINHGFELENVWWSISHYTIFAIIYYIATYYIISKRLNIQ